MRKTFAKKLMELVSKNKNIFLLTGDLGFSVFDDFRKKFPENFINMGLSEANMIGVAAGMATLGKHVFVYSIIPFITYRCLEQIRNDLCLQNLPVKIIGVGEGVSYGAAGPTHHAIEDIGVMASLPNLVIISPGDPFEVEKAIEQSLNLPTPCYVRLGKNEEEKLIPPESDFQIGKGILIKDGKDFAIISAGNMLKTAIQVSETLEKEGLFSKVISLHTIKPLDEQMLKKISTETKEIFVVEEHINSCGLGSRIANFFLREKINVNLTVFGLPDNFVFSVGKQSFLREKFGLDVASIKKRILFELKERK